MIQLTLGCSEVSRKTSETLSFSISTSGKNRHNGTDRFIHKHKTVLFGTGDHMTFSITCTSQRRLERTNRVPKRQANICFVITVKSPTEPEVYRAHTNLLAPEVAYPVQFRAASKSWHCFLTAVNPLFTYQSVCNLTSD